MGFRTYVSTERGCQIRGGIRGVPFEVGIQLDTILPGTI